MSELEKNYKKLQRRVFILEQAVEALLERDTGYLDRFPAFNDQVERKAIYGSLIQSIKFDFIAETGTKWGNTTCYIASNSHQSVVYTSELIRESFLIARERLKHFPNVHVENLDSRELIRKLIQQDAESNKVPLFYLDAHWYKDLPLLEEVQLIAKHWQDFSAIIDDFQVPGDPGYGYDDYGEGQELTLDYLMPAIREFDLKAFFPAALSDIETGACRGCVVICGSRGEIYKKLQQNEKLTEFIMAN